MNGPIRVAACTGAVLALLPFAAVAQDVNGNTSSSTILPFFDPPSFVVAGVTDASNRGGHGSDPILHSTEALVKATASLGGTVNKGEDLETVRAYQRAAEIDPSESHIFDWGAELLTHRAAEQSIEVFSRGNKLFPRSTRMLSGLAAAFYSRGSWDQAERFFFAAADLNPGDPAPYLLLGLVRNSPVGSSDGFAERMERFARLQPENAWANYYYAVNLSQTMPARAQSLLEKAVRLDPGMGAAWLELGILFAEQGKYSQAIPAWQRAIAAGVIEAHYRLAQAWRRTGEPEKAKAEIEKFEQLSKQSAEKEERERTAIPEFVFTLRDRK
jgi:tetratricopeptide (TPR) repeat protein